MTQLLDARRLVAPTVPFVAAALALGASACHRSPELTPDAPSVKTIASVGFDEPENLVYDSVADVYLVSNIVGQPAARDDNGFVSRVSPDGRVLALKWIAGGVNGATLDAPKGLAIHGDTLAVADVGAVHFFDRRTGAPLGSVSIPGLVMNDLAFAPDGTLWVTDTGPDRSGSTPPDTTKDMDAVWRVALRGPNEGRARSAARGLALGRPDGLVLDGAGVLITTFGAHRLERVGAGTPGSWNTAASLPAGRDDGLRRLPDGSLAVTSWDARAVWRLRLGSKPTPILTEVTSPAGVAVDSRRDRLAVTSMQGNAMYLVPLR